jgi:hypothetical protein
MCKKLNCILAVALLVILFAHVRAQVDIVKANLTHSWTFNDGTANDYVGGANGTLMGAAFIADGSLFTDSPHSWMEMPADKIAINTYNEITIEAWFSSVGGGNTAYTMLANFGDTKNTVGVNYFFFCAARGDDKSRAAISCGAETNPWSSESGTNGPEYDDGELHHMVSTLDSTNITLYIDGQLQASTPLTSGNRIANISPQHAYLSKSGYDGDSTWLGLILEFNIYKKVLSADEILLLFNKGATPTGIDDRKTFLPKEFLLSQNYPNPFNPTTTIEFALTKSGSASLKMYDVLGRPVATLVKGDLQAGYHTVNFNASNLTSGVYFYLLQAGDFSSVKKLIVMK